MTSRTSATGSSSRRVTAVASPPGRTFLRRISFRMTVPLTWLGHASFRLDSPGGKRIYVDPWLGNPKCPESEKEPERIDLIAVTHGHGDHVGDTVELWNTFQPPVIALVELRSWLATQGLPGDMSEAPNKGGTVDVDGVKVTLTDANHSSSGDDGQYLG